MPWSAALPQARASLFGRVVNARTRLPITGARIILTGVPDTLTADETGRFAAESLAAGPYVLEVRAFGYDPARWSIELGEGRLDVAIEIEARIQQLDTIRVTAPGEFNNPNDWRSAAAFELRRRRGTGQFITPEYLAQSQARTLAEILRTVPGLWVICRGGGAFGHCDVRLAAGPRGPCLPRYLLDGSPAGIAAGADFPLVRIRGIEIYGASEAPPEMQTINDQCGVIAMWTRMERMER